MKIAPNKGYILPKWDNDYAYRATALAYIQREEVDEVENVNGRWYSKQEIEQSINIKR